MLLNDVIKEIRRNRGITQVELGQLVNLSQTEVSLIENGHQFPRPKLLKEIIENLNSSSDRPLDSNEWLKILHYYINYYLSELIGDSLVTTSNPETGNATSTKIDFDNNFKIEVKIIQTTIGV